MNRTLPRNSEIFVSCFVLAIALLLLVPLPTFILDLLLVINLAVAFFLLLVVLYMPNAVQLLAFPTLLLLTTLFRLGLNVASTRLILSDGDAGEVIEAFGTFLVGGKLLVGIVVFGIITVINLIVIARGSSRISEVAARFALDSLPGKQMSIDADLRAGLISPQDAERKREQLRKESQLYGAMDGAMKFVQGDALAGVVIIFTNVIGGLSLGVYHGMPLSEAAEFYTTLTVGDGLVSQIPAFLIAVCAGLVVTRIGSSSETTLGGELRDQLFDKPAALLVVGGFLFLLSFLEGMPQVPFLIISGGCVVFWYALRRRGAPLLWQGERRDGDLQLISEHEAPQMLFASELNFTIALGRERLGEEFRRKEEAIRNFCRTLSGEAQSYFGVVLPTLRFEIDHSLGAREYEIRRGPQTLIRYEVPDGGYFAPVHPTQARVLGLAVLSEEATPIFGGLGVWLHDEGREQHFYTRQMLSCFNVTAYHWSEFATLQLFEYCRRNPEEVLTMSWLHAQLKDLENIQPGLISDSFEQARMTVSRLLNILHQLLKEGLPFPGLPRLIEDVSTYYSSAGGGFDDDGDDFDMSDLINFLRQRNRELLLGGRRSGSEGIRVVKMSPSVEAMMMRAGGRLMETNMKLSRPDYQALRDSLEQVLSSARQRGILPISLQCPEVLRVPLFHFLHSLTFTVPMVCEEEIDLKTPKAVLSEWSVASE
ncbi:flagellar biosynthesis protein FlhA [bacterium]|nr:flagellar biosynthesis protein FlhA [bacterium]